MGIRQLAWRAATRLIRQAVHPLFPPLPPPFTNGFRLYILLLGYRKHGLAF